MRLFILAALVAGAIAAFAPGEGAGIEKAFAELPDAANDVVSVDPYQDCA